MSDVFNVTVSIPPPTSFAVGVDGNGIPGNGIDSVTDNGNGTLTFNFTDGSSYTTPDLRGDPGLDAPQPYIHTQSSPSLEWIVNHNKGYYPVGQVVVGGQVVGATITHFSLNQARVGFGSPQTGSAIFI